MILLLLLALQDAAETKQLLNSDDPAARKRGIEALAKLKGSEKDDAIKAANELLEQKKTEFDKLSDELKSLIDPRKIKKPVDEWLKHREKALGAIMNTGSFPDPRPGAKISGPYKGFDKVDAALKKVQDAYDELAKAVDAIQALILAQSVKKLNELEARIKELEEALGKSNSGKTWSDAFWDAAVKLEEGNLSCSLDSIASVHHPLLFFLYGRAFMKAELAADNGMSEKEKQGAQAINRLRIMLGVVPLEGDARLAKSIDLHIEDMEKNGYFGHVEKNEETKTPQQRCQKQGYKGTTGEDIASSPEPDKCIDMWKWDGGHFRNMINPGYVQIGLGIGKSNCGFNVGSGDGAKRPRFDVPWK